MKGLSVDINVEGRKYTNMNEDEFVCLTISNMKLIVVSVVNLELNQIENCQKQKLQLISNRGET